MNWLQSVMMGFVSGLCEPMPICAEAHRGILSHFFGLTALDPLCLLACHTAALIVVLSAGRLELYRLWRTAKILRQPHRRSGHPSLNQAGTLRLLRGAAVFAIIGRLLSYQLESVTARIWLLAVPLFVSGLLLWLPTHFRTANKDGRHLSRLDGLLLGLASLMAAVPGISLVCAVLSMASVRGVQRQFAVRFAWLLLSVSLMTGVAMDLLLIVRSGLSLTPALLLSAGLCGGAAALGSWLAILFVRSRTRPGAGGVSEFCFYNWGLALLCLALFLLV